MTTCIRYDLQSAIDIVFDKQRSRYVRAVKLFGLQAAIVACHGVASGSCIVVDRKLMRAARARATFAVLRYAAAQIDDFSDLLKDADTRAILRRFLLKNGDLRRAGKGIRPFPLRKRLVRSDVRCKSIAKMASFSCRFDRKKALPRRRGGRTDAAETLARTKHPDFIVSLGVEALKTNGKRYEPVLALLHLAYIDNFPLRPYRLGDTLAETLISVIDDEKLQQVGALYGSVRAQLIDRYPNVVSLNFPLRIRPEHMTFMPLPDELYKQAR